MNIENMNLFKGFDLFFDDIKEEKLKAICQNLGGDVSYNIEQKSITYMCENKIFIENIKLGDCHQMVSSLGERYASELDCKFLHSELYFLRDRRSIHHWDIPNVEIVSVTYRS